MKNTEKPNFIKRAIDAKRNEKKAEKETNIARESNREKAEKAAKENRENCRAKRKEIVDVATLIFVFCTAVATGFYTCVSWHQLAEARKQTTAVMRQASSDRAWIFVEFIKISDLNQASNDPSKIWISVQYRLHNYGKTPAVITSISPHFFWKGDYSNFTEPDPISAGIDFREEVLTQTFADINENVGRPELFETENEAGKTAENKLIVPAESVSPTINGDFSFRRRNISSIEDFNDATHSARWFYCRVKYKSMFGDPAETSYFMEITNVGMPKLPSQKNDQNYNYWK